MSLYETMDRVQFRWTDEAHARLAELWPHHTARQISEILTEETNETVGRLAVIAKANKLGFPKKEFKRHKQEPLEFKTKTIKPIKRIPYKVKQSKAYGIPTSLLDLTHDQCRWPLGHPGQKNFHFCGAQRNSSRPYCENHNLLAYKEKHA